MNAAKHGTMSGTELSVCLPGADARTIQRAGKAADAFGLAQLWAGSPRAASGPSVPNSDDNYVLPALAATAAVTQSVRLGAFLSLPEAVQPMRIAEDIAIVDAASRGRVEAGLVVPSQGVRAWEARATALLGAWHYWPGKQGETYCVTPPLQQGWLPRLLVGGSEPLAMRLGAGRACWTDVRGAGAASRVARRIALMVEFSGGVEAALAPDPVACVIELRRKVDAAGAHQLIALIPANANVERELRALGSVVSPGIRCAPDECAQLTRDGWNWMHEQAHLHVSPYERN